MESKIIIDIRPTFIAYFDVLGDPQLSVLDSLKIFELMHVIRVDFPTDDGLVDFLTISTSKLNVVPDQIYLSDNGTSPLNVSVGNVTSLTTISSSQRQVTNSLSL